MKNYQVREQFSVLLAAFVAGCDAMAVAAGDDNGLIGNNCMLANASREARRLLASGKLGEPKVAGVKWIGAGAMQNGKVVHETTLSPDGKPAPVELANVRQTGGTDEPTRNYNPPVTKTVADANRKAPPQQPKAEAPKVEPVAKTPATDDLSDLPADIAAKITSGAMMPELAQRFIKSWRERHLNSDAPIAVPTPDVPDASGLEL